MCHVSVLFLYVSAFYLVSVDVLLTFIYFSFFVLTYSFPVITC